LAVSRYQLATCRVEIIANSGNDGLTLFCTFSRINLIVLTCVKKLTLYYRCQLFGWAGYYIINFLISLTWVKQGSNSSVYTRILFMLLITTGIGFLLTHLVRNMLKKLLFFKMPVKKQAVFFVFIAILGAYLFAVACIYLEQATGLMIWRSLYSKKLFLFITRFVYGVTAFPFISWLLIYFLVHFVWQRTKIEQEKMVSEKKILDLKRKSLRAQMNPRFVFESIGLLNGFIREGQTELAVTHLTNFSKLIRILFVNADKDEISLYEEIELCRYYLRMEQLKPGKGFHADIQVSGNPDLKSFFITPLFLQSFIGRTIKSGSRSLNILIEYPDERLKITVTCDTITGLTDDLITPVLAQADKGSLTYWKPEAINLSNKWDFSMSRIHEQRFCLTLNYKEDA
jgi:two-component system, LytTR family, sensor kinase